MKPERINELISVYRDGLLNETLPFWLSCCVDREHGGFMMAVDQDGTIIDTDKGVWQQARFTWMLGELFNQVDTEESEQHKTWLELARHGADFLEQHCFDPNDNRMWFHVTREGLPIRKRRYSFTESFAAIAFGELYQATGDDRYSQKANAAFRQFIDHNVDPKGVQPKFTDTRPTINIGFPMIAIATIQELRESIGLADANCLIDQQIETIRNLFMKPELGCVMETVSPNGDLLNHFDGRTLNPGHAIEAAWFILREGKFRRNQSFIETGLTILDWMLERGWDTDHGGILYFVDVHGLPIQEYWHDMKFWWPHNEAIIATLLAWQLTGDEKYSKWHSKIHNWSYSHFADPEHGEWFGYLHRDGSVSSRLKGNLWKGPFHFPRMQLTCWKILEQVKQAQAN